MKNIDTDKFFNFLRTEYDLRSQADIARFFNESPQNIGNWKKRSFINENVVLEKIPNLELNRFLIGSTEEQQKDNKQQVATISERDYYLLEGRYKEIKEQYERNQDRVLLILERLEGKLTQDTQAPVVSDNKKAVDTQHKIIMTHQQRSNTGQRNTGSERVPVHDHSADPVP